MLTGTGRINKKGRTGGHVLYISRDITTDSNYPFKPNEGHGEPVDLVLKNGCLVVSKKKETKQK